MIKLRDQVKERFEIETSKNISYEIVTISNKNINQYSICNYVASKFA